MPPLVFEARQKYFKALAEGLNTMLMWELMNGANAYHIGYLPQMLSYHDRRPAAEQFAENYCGGWDSFKSCTYNPNNSTLSYPGDPVMYPLAYVRLRDEHIYVYENAWVCIVQHDGSYDVARLD